MGYAAVQQAGVEGSVQKPAQKASMEWNARRNATVGMAPSAATSQVNALADQDGWETLVPGHVHLEPLAMTARESVSVRMVLPVILSLVLASVAQVTWASTVRKVSRLRNSHRRNIFNFSNQQKIIKNL